MMRKRRIHERVSAAQRAFRDAVRDILESEGWFEIEVAEPRPFRFTPPLQPTATA
jgi:hypothetical protein